MTLVEFLLARIAEDELTAQMAIQTRRPEWMRAENLADGVDRVVEAGGALICSPSEQEMTDHIVRWDPAHVLAECAAKRAILESHGAGLHECPGGRYTNPDGSPAEWADSGWMDAEQCFVVRYLAQPYTDHPDFDPAWKPAA